MQHQNLLGEPPATRLPGNEAARCAQFLRDSSATAAETLTGGLGPA